MMRFSTFLIAASFASVSLAATITFDCTKVPNICDNDLYATRCQGKPTVLHRDSADATVHRANNACKSPNRCSGNPDDSNSCDEYPYATASEGGAGAVTRCVPAHENSVQGGTLSSFYTSNSIGQGDAFSVAFATTSGLAYATSCSNSGNELIRREPRGSATMYNNRYFLSSEGHEILMLEPVDAPGSLDSMVGTQTWLAHEERHVTLTKAL